MVNVVPVVAALTATSAALNSAAALRSSTALNSAAARNAAAIARYRELKKIKKNTIPSTLKESFDNAYKRMLERITKEDQALTPQQQAATPKAKHFLHSEVSGDISYYEDGKTRQESMFVNSWPSYHKSVSYYDRKGNKIEHSEEISDGLTEICRTRKTIYYENSSRPEFVYTNDETGEQCQHFDRDGREDTKRFLTKQILKKQVRSKIDQKYAEAKGEPDHKPVLKNKKIAVLRAALKARFGKDEPNKVVSMHTAAVAPGTVKGRSRNRCIDKD